MVDPIRPYGDSQHSSPFSHAEQSEGESNFMSSPGRVSQAADASHCQPFKSWRRTSGFGRSEPNKRPTQPHWS
ncbi:hypothetical protein J2785_007282 [Burkholderia ambifaria]|nr:hypothetical protein [Burkholderia ambifaria]